jgi:hypothetical protein
MYRRIMVLKFSVSAEMVCLYYLWCQSALASLLVERAHELTPAAVQLIRLRNVAWVFLPFFTSATEASFECVEVLPAVPVQQRSR